MNANWSLVNKGGLCLSVRNLLDNQTIVSRQPYGARSNAPRAILIGFKYALQEAL